MQFEFTAPLWEYEGDAPWVFVTLPTKVADDIDERVPERKGFGSVRVSVAIGDSNWRTSIFPDKASGSFVLPVKKAIRELEGLVPGDQATIRLEPVAD